MFMGDYWQCVMSKLSVGQVKTQFPEAFKALKKDDVPSGGEFAYDVIPNMGPGGPTSDEDEADLSERDPDEEIGDADGPSLSGDKALMVYNSEIDELWVWNEGGGAPGEWMMWNY